MSMYYGMSLPFDASHMNGMLTSSLYSSSTTPTHLSQQQQQPLALPLSLAPSMSSAVSLQQYQQLIILQQLQQQQQQLEAANARSPAGEEGKIAQQSHQQHPQHQQQQQQQQRQHPQPQQHGSLEAHSSGLASHSASGFSPLSSPSHATSGSSHASHSCSTSSSLATARFDHYTNVNEAMSDNEYVTMLAERWRSGGYDGQSLRQLAVDDLAERRKARRRFPHPLSTAVMSPSSSALAASALAHSSVSSPLRALHTPLRLSGHGGGAHLAVPTPSSFLSSHFNFSPLSPSNHVSPTASTPASLLSPGRDGLGPLFSPSRFYASPADRHGKPTKKRVRDSDMSLQPLNLATDEDEQQHPQQHEQRQQQRPAHSSYVHVHPNAHNATNGRHVDEGEHNKVAHVQLRDNSNKRQASSGNNTTRTRQQRAGRKQDGEAVNKRGGSRRAKQQKDEQQQHDSNSSHSKQRGQQQHPHSATNGAGTSSSTSLIPFPLSSLATPMRPTKTDPLFSPNDASRLTVDAPSLFSPLQTPQRPAAQHNQFFSETPQHSYTHLFSPGPALFASSSSHFPSPAVFQGMTPATPERKHRTRLTASSPIQLLLPSPLSSPATSNEQHQPHYNGNSSNQNDKHDEKPTSSSQCSLTVSASTVTLTGVGSASGVGSSTSPSISPTLVPLPLTFPATPTPLDKKRESQDGSGFLSVNGIQRATDDDSNHDNSDSGAAVGQSNAASQSASPSSSSASSDSSAAASMFSPAPSTLRFEPLHDLNDVVTPYRLSLSLTLPLPMSLQSPFATPSVPARHRSTAHLLSSPSSSMADHDTLRPPHNSSRADAPIAQSTPSQLIPLLPATPSTERRHDGTEAANSSEWDEMDKDKTQQQQPVEHSLPEPMMIA